MAGLLARRDSRVASALANPINRRSLDLLHQSQPAPAPPYPMAHNDVLIVIPARMASTRLPGKPLADIAGEPMIVHVMRRAQEAGLGAVVVAIDSEAIFTCVEKAGGRAVMTRADHVSGSDRIFEALGSAAPTGRCGIVVNVQGDLPTLRPADIAAAVAPLQDAAVDI